MNPRLAVLLSHVKGPILADVGCDHALLAAAAVKTGRARKVYACDIAEGPLNRARATIAKEGVTDSVIPLLSDGLAALPEFCDQIVIAGMGAETIVEILTAGSGKLGPGTRLLLSPHTKAWLLRQWLEEHGWIICQEQFVQDRERFYPVMDVRPGSTGSGLKPEERLFGVSPLQDETWSMYLDSERTRLHQLLERVPSPVKPGIRRQLELLEKAAGQ
ncbi:class I SAM-dependent methyltransferase [uncultured Faecalibaculum sp.]|uniref:tRNA (adenine(22)-N(1))-methyltransferase n=1 Tax=uncultured Faecalibaculum sp. TaxID=1729681 RepID=UPI00263432BF|nr:class I SAM-dependent methyltransferase [uncultured Faecalibaculum sp.]